MCWMLQDRGIESRRRQETERSKRSRGNDSDEESVNTKRGRSTDDEYYDRIKEQLKNWDRMDTSGEFDEHATSENSEEIRREAEMVFNMIQQERREENQNEAGEVLNKEGSKHG